MKINQNLSKLYYSIGEVAEMFDVSNSLIRYWETEFKVLKPTKNRKGDRRFMVKDIRTLEKIYTLVKERGFTLEGAKKEMKSKSQNPTEVISKLRKTRDKLEGILKLMDA
ncbi:MAG: MerR family transcriptional regulator [Saprospiraceae bacterium]|nr:MerR family transcriptional regulator [Saprospiraceae bacterium]